jgi:hypothetical protein
MRRRTTLEVSHPVSDIQAVVVAGSVHISGYIPGIARSALALIRRRRATLEVRYSISDIQTIVATAAIGIAGDIGAAPSRS